VNRDRVLTIFLVTVWIAIAFVATRSGWDYYTVPLIDRPDSPLHEALKPTGGVGHMYGIVGATRRPYMPSEISPAISPNERIPTMIHRPGIPSGISSREAAITATAPMASNVFILESYDIRARGDSNTKNGDAQWTPPFRSRNLIQAAPGCFPFLQVYGQEERHA